MIKLELNYSLRAHVLAPEKRPIVTDIFGNTFPIYTVAPIEIFASKINALLSRAAARDLYDINKMIDSNLLIGQEDILRKCIIFYASITSDNLNQIFSTDAIDSISLTKIRRDLLPILTYEERHQGFNLDSRKRNVKDYIQSILIPVASEKEYLMYFSNKEYRPALLFQDQDILERIIDHPMAIWRCRK